MREILFRGKDKENGKWITGFLVSSKHIGDWVTAWPVDPKTVGQFTGLTDKNGKKIFEHDIVQAHFRNNHSKQTFRVIFDDGMFLFDNNHVKVPKYDIYSMKVIGNIHDNPELLGGADNG
jgi:uncharacterized phage protein (TIGR01671 family)